MLCYVAGQYFVFTTEVNLTQCFRYNSGPLFVVHRKSSGRIKVVTIIIQSETCKKRISPDMCGYSLNSTGSTLILC